MPAADASSRIDVLPPSRAARREVSPLLTSLLRRLLRPVVGVSLRLSMTAAAVFVTWQMPAMAAGPAANTLPTGGAVTYGNATITQNGNALNINQSSASAIASFTNFSIGSGAVVNVNQPGAMSSFLARVTGSDPSQIYGLLKSNGTVALINQNGILVGPTGVVDVARFIASTLNISDSDFLAGRLNFSSVGSTGDVVNQGVIKTASGGSVYLIGANVENGGVITSPNGEILLAAGQTVQLVDTGTPGVTVNVTGTAGQATNLGNVSAEAGRIGVAAGLINNSGEINASSVVNEGGRIFLRATQNLTTTATSNISASGATQGGNVVLTSDKIAYLDGNIAATGAAGQGGYVETSGKQSLDVVKLPTIGSGGQWYIDPYDLEVVGSGDNNIATYGNVVSSIGPSSTVTAGTVAGLLNGGINVTLATGADGGTTGGNITVNAAIAKTSGAAAALTLNADNDININANITSTSNTLGLNLNTNSNGVNSGAHAVNVAGSTISLNGGALNVSDGNVTPNRGNLVLDAGATVDFSQGGALTTGNLTLQSGSTLNSDLSTSLNINGTLTNGGTLTLQNSSFTASSVVNTGTATFATTTGSASNFTNSGNLSITSGSAISGEQFTNDGNVTLNNAALNVGTFTNDAGANLSGNGSISVASGSGNLLNNGTLSPGGDGVIGSLSVNGGYTQGSTGTLLIDVAGAGTFDTLNYTLSSLSLNGTLQTHLLNGYVPTLGTSFAVLSGPDSSTSTGVFRHVLGDVINAGGVLEMIKPVYNGPGQSVSLRMAGSETITYTGTAESQWGQANFWSTGYFPTAIDNVLVPAGSRLSHGIYDGVDTVNSITLDAGANLYLSGGTLNVNNMNSNGTVDLDGGLLSVTGIANLVSLSLTNGATLLGSGTGSQLNVTHDFSQYGGTISTNGDMSVTPATGDLVVGDITARNLTLASSGAISQQNAPLHVTQQLSTSSANGTMLNLSGNQIAAISATNSTVGDVAIVNNLNAADTSAVNLNRITNSGGNVSVSNTGAMIAGAGGVNATGGIALSVADTSSSADNLVLNGVLASAGGNVDVFAGNNLSVNANVTTSAPGVATFAVAHGVISYAPGVSITDGNGTVIPVAAVAPPIVTPVPPVVTPVPPVVAPTSPPDTSDTSDTSAIVQAVTQTVAPVSNATVQAIASSQTVATNVTSPTLPTTTSNSTADEPTTVGGESNSFGGTDTTASSSPTTPTKAVATKMYCN